MFDLFKRSGTQDQPTSIELLGRAGLFSVVLDEPEASLAWDEDGSTYILWVPPPTSAAELVEIADLLGMSSAEWWQGLLFPTEAPLLPLEALSQGSGE